MTDFTDFKTQILEWINRDDFSDVLVTSFVRMAEQKFNAELRVSRMIKNATLTATDRCATLPDDWLEFELVQAANTSVPGGWLPITYKARHEFYMLPDKWACRHYTIEGRQVFFGGAPDAVEGIKFQIFYFAEVPIFSDQLPSWIYTKYPSLYLSAALLYAYMHAIGEEGQAAGAKTLTEDSIQKLNSEYKLSKASGSRLKRTRVRSFG